MTSTKLFTLVKARGSEDRAAMRRWVLDQAAPALLANSDMRGLMVNLVDVDPGTAEWVRPGEVRTTAPTTPDYDVVIESWVPAGTERTAAQELGKSLAERAGEVWTYAATEWIEKQKRTRSGPERSPGIKYIVLCRFFDDLPASAGKRSWANHVKLALRVHIGMDIYIRNWIDNMLTSGAPRVDGIGQLFFPTVEDMRERWFSSEHGRNEVIQDIGHFLQSGTRLYTSEYVLRDSTPPR